MTAVPGDTGTSAAAQRFCTRLAPLISQHCAAAALLVAFGGLLAAASCGDPGRRGFACGVAARYDKSIIQTCSGEHEICVCRTNQCAQRVPSAACKSGARYLDGPFGGIASTGGAGGTAAGARPRPGDCVTDEDIGWIVDENGSGAACRTDPAATQTSSESSSTSASSSDGSSTSSDSSSSTAESSGSAGSSSSGAMQ